MSNIRESEPSLGELVADVGRDLSTLVRKELELAKVEARTEVRTLARSAAAFAVAAVALLICLVMLSTALAWWIAEGLHVAVAFALVGALWLAIGAIAVSIARAAARRMQPMPETTDALKAAIHGDSARNQPSASTASSLDDIIVDPTHQISDSRRNVRKEVP